MIQGAVEGDLGPESVLSGLCWLASRVPGASLGSSFSCLEEGYCWPCWQCLLYRTGKDANQGLFLIQF